MLSGKPRINRCFGSAARWAETEEQSTRRGPKPFHMRSSWQEKKKKIKKNFKSFVEAKNVSKTVASPEGQLTILPM